MRIYFDNIDDAYFGCIKEILNKKIENRKNSNKVLYSLSEECLLYMIEDDYAILQLQFDILNN